MRQVQGRRRVRGDFCPARCLLHGRHVPCLARLLPQRMARADRTADRTADRVGAARKTPHALSLIQPTPESLMYPMRKSMILLRKPYQNGSNQADQSYDLASRLSHPGTKHLARGTPSLRRRIQKELNRIRRPPWGIRLLRHKVVGVAVCNRCSLVVVVCSPGVLEFGSCHLVLDCLESCDL